MLTKYKKRLEAITRAMPRHTYHSPMLMFERYNFGDPDEFLIIDGKRMTPGEADAFIQKYFENDTKEKEWTDAREVSVMYVDLGRWERIRRKAGVKSKDEEAENDEEAETDEGDSPT